MRQIVVPLPDVSTLRRGAFYGLVFLLAIYVVWVVREIWLPLGLAFLIATVLDPVVDRMEARGWRRGPATSFIFGSFLLLFVGLCALATPLLVREIEVVRTQFSRFFPDTSPSGLRGSFERMNLPGWLAAIGVRVFESGQAGFQRSSTWLTDYGMRFVSNLIWVVIVPIVAFYALRDFHLMLAKLLLLVPKRRRELAQTTVAEVSAVFAKYLRALMVVSALNGVATWALLLALRVPSALMLGVVAGVLYSVPYIGALLTIVLTMAAAFVGGGMQMMLVATSLSLILHQIVFDQIISPRVLGGQVGLHPIISIVALLAGNLLLGIVGMILAVPVAACIQIGVLALVPKLRLEIDVPTGPTSHPAAVLAEEAKEVQRDTDATEDLHASVNKAVTNIEAKVEQSGGA